VTELSLTSVVLLPFGLGLLGFVEPCTIGSSLIFVKHMEGRNAGHKLAEVSLFTITRALFVGALGMLAVAIGAAFLGLQRGAWIALGTGYIVIGAVYIAGRAGRLMVALGPSLSRLSGLHGSIGLGVLLGLNIPACAAPLILALLGAAAAGGASGATFAMGFVSLALFGLALSLPLIVAVLFAPARRALDWIAGLTQRVPLWTGVVLIALGLWSVWFGLFVKLGPIV
jgi:cytochrome c-type biogenesis protein